MAKIWPIERAYAVILVLRGRIGQNLPRLALKLGNWGLKSRHSRQNRSSLRLASMYVGLGPLKRVMRCGHWTNQCSRAVILRKRANWPKGDVGLTRL